MIALVISVLAVAEVITVRFVGRDADKNRYVKLDSVAVANLTKNWTQTVVYPDTVMELEPQSTAIQEVAVSKFGIAELSPNPAEGVAYFNLAVPKSGKVVLTLTDLNGRSLLTQEEEMPVGVYAFRLTMPEATSFVVRATNGSEISVAKVINLKPAAEMSLTQIARISDVKRIMQKAVQIGSNDYEKDDEMQYIGFVSVGDSTFTSDTITQVQAADEEIELIFHLCEPIETEFLATECDEYIWNEIKLSESGKYDQTFTAANGCDSIVTLNLTVNKSVKNEITEIACDSLKWNDQTYTASGDYTQIFTAANGCDSIVTFHYRRGFIDKRDSTFYKIVKIGDQLWMQENLRYLPQVDNTSNMANPRYYVYGYTGTDVAKAKATENYKTYGTLYNWPAAQAAVPAGWKLPTRAEWQTLINTVGSANAGAKLAGRADLWTAGNLTNSADFGTSGFEGLPAGMIMTSNIAPGGSTRWWTATTASSTQSIYFIIYYSYTLLDLDKADNTHGYSVRCLYVGPTE